MRACCLFVFLIFAQCAQSQPSAGCATESTLARSAGEIVFDGVDRRYLIDLPVRGSQPPPLLLALHGYTGSPEIIGAPMTGEFVKYVIDRGLVLVRPASTEFEAEWPDTRELRPIASWNDLAGSRSEGPAGPLCEADANVYPCPPECGECGSCVWASCHDDVGFIAALIDELDEHHCFDRSKRYVLGHSNGGMMAHALTCERPDIFAGGASIKGQPQIGFACARDAAPSFIQVTGAHDRTVPPDGAVADDGFFYEPAELSAEVRASALQCARGPVIQAISDSADVECALWDQCLEGKRVADCIDPDGGHEWPADSVHGQWGIKLIIDFLTGQALD